MRGERSPAEGEQSSSFLLTFEQEIVLVVSVPHSRRGRADA